MKNATPIMPSRSRARSVWVEHLGDALDPAVQFSESEGSFMEKTTIIAVHLFAMRANDRREGH
ncbi:hypothetical protein SFIMM107S_04430 [Streptomyces griseus]